MTLLTLPAAIRIDSEVQATLAANVLPLAIVVLLAFLLMGATFLDKRF